MAKLSGEELARIVERDLPGYRVARQSRVERETEDESGAVGAADSYGGGLSRESSLAEKYLGGGAADEDTGAASADALLRGANPGRHYHHDDSADDDEEEIVAVEPESASHPWDRGARPKAVVIKNKKIIGMQG